MLLNKATSELIKQHLGSRWEKIGKKPCCAMCGCEAFSIQDRIYQVVEYKPASEKEMSAVPMIGVVCNGCQLTFWVSAILSGVLVNTDKDNQTEIKFGEGEKKHE